MPTLYLPDGTPSIDLDDCAITQLGLADLMALPYTAGVVSYFAALAKGAPPPVDEDADVLPDLQLDLVERCGRALGKLVSTADAAMTNVDVKAHPVLPLSINEVAGDVFIQLAQLGALVLLRERSLPAT